MNTSNTPNHPESSRETSSGVTLFHPFVARALGTEQLTPPDVADSLDNCASTLFLLADLFGDPDPERYPILESRDTRRGLFLQLHSIGNALEWISEQIVERRILKI